ILNAAPAWTKALSKRIRKSLPDLREDAEASVGALFDAGAAPPRLMPEEAYRAFLRKHRPQLERRFAELQVNPKGSPEAVRELATGLEQDFEVTMLAEAAALLDKFRRANAAWRALSAGNDLSDEAALQRRVWMLARRVYLQEADPA